MTRYLRVLLMMTIGAVCVSAQTAAGPAAVSVTPASGEGPGRTFSFVFSNAGGASAIATTEALIVGGTAVTGANACYFFAAGNLLWLRDDAHTAWLGPVTAGTSGTLTNSQCTVAASGFSMRASGDTLTMTVPVTFLAAFAGTKTILSRAIDRAGLPSDLARGGVFTVDAQTPQLDVMTSSCGNPASDAGLGISITSEQGGRVSKFLVTPSCFPGYASYLPQEGLFLDTDARPLAIMGRTCGHFDVLVVFVDTDGNRRKLYDNPTVPDGVKAKIADGKIQEAVTDLFASYTTASIMDGFHSKVAVKAVGFTFSVGLTRLSQRDLDLTDGGLGFASHDVVVVLDDMGPISAHGVERWPAQLTRPVFYGKDGGFFLHVDPFRLTPALFGHELLHRNVPGLLKEYQFGEPVRVVENGTTYDRTPIINPRTGENIEPFIRANAGLIPMIEYIGGFGDVDGDGIPDCMDPVITPTADNVDGDFIPDRFDPDLRFNHRAYTWMYAAR